jgi:preprotein translocase subunit YajC
MTALALLALMTPSPNNAAYQSIFMIVAFFAIMYFFLIAPQSRQRREHEQRVFNLKKGDEVVTAGGIIGEVVHIRETMKEGKAEKTLEDRVTIKSGDSRLIVERGRIARVLTGAQTSAPAS